MQFSWRKSLKGKWLYLGISMDSEDEEEERQSLEFFFRERLSLRTRHQRNYPSRRLRNLHAYTEGLPNPRGI